MTATEQALIAPTFENRPPRTPGPIDPFSVDDFVSLYDEFSADLMTVREKLRHIREMSTMRTQFDDLEAELMYLRIRASKPEHLVEMSPLDGWSTLWILHAIKENQRGHLRSFDVHDRSREYVPKDLATRWDLVRGDVRRNSSRMPDQIDFLLVDSDHSRTFAKWYFKRIIPKVCSGGTVIIHDVLSPWGESPCTEGSVVRRELRSRELGMFAVSKWSRAGRKAALQLTKRRGELGFDADLVSSSVNPAVFIHWSKSMPAGQLPSLGLRAKVRGETRHQSERRVNVSQVV